MCMQDDIKDVSNENGGCGIDARPLVCIIGAGNVATHLADALSKVADVRQIVSKHCASAARVCKAIGNGCQPVEDIGCLYRHADYYVVAVNDDSVKEVAEATKGFGGIWVHTSGSVPASVFEGNKERYGVLYPLQTFSRDIPVDVCKVPFFVEGSDDFVAKSIYSLASKLSATIEYADSLRRKKLHLAAVFACNFANQMWVEADGILRESGLSIDYLMPLLRVTLAKLEATTPMNAMTGPARRGDMAVIDAQMDQLSGQRKEIYRLLSNRILEEFALCQGQER